MEKVYYIVPRIDLEERKAMGWNGGFLMGEGGVQVMIAPKDVEVKHIFEKCESHCFFSGIRANVDVFRWLSLSLAYKVKRYLIPEPPYTFNKPLWMHYIRFFIQNYKYAKFFDGVFAIGASCAEFYKNISSKWKVFPFVYVTDMVDAESVPCDGNLKVLFVGSLCKRKNVKVLVHAMNGLKNVKLAIVGDGEERMKLEPYANNNRLNVDFLGTKQMSEIPPLMQRYDMLVLPSLHDGWGAVVNEAMLQGVYVVCSNKCGARDLILSNKFGQVFLNNNIDSLQAILKNAAKDVVAIRKNRSVRMEWARTHINGKVVADYFLKCLDEKQSVPACPWKQF